MIKRLRLLLLALVSVTALATAGLSATAGPASADAGSTCLAPSLWGSANNATVGPYGIEVVTITTNGFTSADCYGPSNRQYRWDVSYVTPNATHTLSSTGDEAATNGTFTSTATHIDFPSFNISRPTTVADANLTIHVTSYSRLVGATTWTTGVQQTYKITVPTSHFDTTDMRQGAWTYTDINGKVYCC